MFLIIFFSGTHPMLKQACTEIVATIDQSNVKINLKFTIVTNLESKF